MRVFNYCFTDLQLTLQKVSNEIILKAKNSDKLLEHNWATNIAI